MQWKFNVNYFFTILYLVMRYSILCFKDLLSINLYSSDYKNVSLINNKTDFILSETAS